MIRSRNEAGLPEAVPLKERCSSGKPSHPNVQARKGAGTGHMLTLEPAQNNLDDLFCPRRRLALCGCAALRQSRERDRYLLPAIAGGRSPVQLSRRRRGRNVGKGLPEGRLPEGDQGGQWQ
jgi:hypothetical protein